MARASARVPAVAERSHVAGPAAVALLFVGLLLASYSALIPLLLGLGLVSASLGFLSARLNPFSLGFYLPTKPSWTAIALAGLVGMVLVAAAYAELRSGRAPLWPRSLP